MPHEASSECLLYQDELLRGAAMPKQNLLHICKFSLQKDGMLERCSYLTSTYQFSCQTFIKGELLFSSPLLDTEKFAQEEIIDVLDAPMLLNR